MRRLALVAVCSLFAVSVTAQQNPAAEAARQWRAQHERAIIDEFVALLKIPNVASNRPDIQRNAELIANLLQQRGARAQLLSVPGGNPVVFGEISTPGATRTLVFYAHYDGQPLDPAEWASPPFEPTLRSRSLKEGGKIIALPAAGTPFDPESRLYARGAADDKAPIIAMLAALDAIKAAGIPRKSNIKFAFEGEEEAGSANLEQTLAANKALFAGDLWLMCDSPLHQSRRQSLIFGARSAITADITTYGPVSELHSGHYGNWAPNPAMALARLLTSMKNADGRVLIKGFYADVAPLSAQEKRAIAQAPDIDALLRTEFQLGETDFPTLQLKDVLTMPALNVRGMSSARVGEQASNVIPATATASLDIRLVKGMDPDRTREQFLDHIRAQGFFVVGAEPDATTRLAHPRIAKVTTSKGYPATRTSMELPLVQELIAVVESVRGPTIRIPAMGGGLPLLEVERPLNTHTVVIPIGNHDNNQHSFDENLRIQNLWDGIELMAALITM